MKAQGGNTSEHSVIIEDASGKLMSVDPGYCFTYTDIDPETVRFRCDEGEVEAQTLVYKRENGEEVLCIEIRDVPPPPAPPQGPSELAMRIAAICEENHSHGMSTEGIAKLVDEELERERERDREDEALMEAAEEDW